jgi:hypothetical protein
VIIRGQNEEFFSFSLFFFLSLFFSLQKPQRKQSSFFCKARDGEEFKVGGTRFVCCTTYLAPPCLLPLELPRHTRSERKIELMLLPKIGLAREI